jgi:hypothetical protein
MRHAAGVQDQKTAFAERLKRINAGKQYEHEDVVGYRTQKRFDKLQARRPKRKRTFGQTVMIPVAFCAGASAVLLGRMAYFHLAQLDGLPEAFYDLGSRGMFLFAMVIAGILTISLQLATKGRIYALALGCALMHFGESAAAASLPDLWAEMFSPEYAAEKITEARAMLGSAAG